ncbi:SMC-Scp complex subunit ScpB, partial [Pirellulales bacterium]|nr:SMC-Scp complex subunit ScpB [Pirellulales bacterium]
MSDETSAADARPKPARLSLARLSTAFAQLIAKPDADRPAPSSVSPQMIVEALLFVGRPDSGPFSAEALATPVRDLEPEEVESIVEELNATYCQRGAGYEIVAVRNGYAMQIRRDLASLADRVYGNDQRRKLSPVAVEVLSIVAYRPGITADQINQLRGTRSNQALAKLVQWRLLSVERGNASPREASYRTTDR